MTLRDRRQPHDSNDRRATPDAAPPAAHAGAPNALKYVVAGIAVSVVAGALFREHAGIEWTPDSLRDLVERGGPWGPALFVALVSVRMVVMIPGALLLTAAGLLFGTVGGSIYGAAGLTLTAIGAFGLVRGAGPERLRAHVPARWHPLLAIGRTGAGAGLLALVSGYPIGPSVLAQAGAAASGMALLPFVLAVGAGSIVRAAGFSYFGNAIAEGEGLLFAGGIVAALLSLPLLHPRSRRVLREARTSLFETPPATDHDTAADRSRR